MITMEFHAADAAWITLLDRFELLMNDNRIRGRLLESFLLLFGPCLVILIGKVTAKISSLKALYLCEFI